MRVLYAGPIGCRTGFAVACNDYCSALLRAGVELHIQPLVAFEADDLEDDGYGHLLPCVVGHPDHVPFHGDITHVVIHTVPAAAAMIARDYPRDIPRVLITTWETDRMPDAIRTEIATEFDHFVVPSNFCREVLIMNRWTSVVPHCFDRDRWIRLLEMSELRWPDLAKPQPPLEIHDVKQLTRSNVRMPCSTYRFAAVINWGERKNPVGLLKAYLSEFSSADDVLLTIKTPGYNPDDIVALRDALGYDDVPALEIVTEHEDMIDFYAGQDCIVSASRGEGWNLPLFEAAICGLPVIAPDWGGQVDFLGDYPNRHLYGGTLTPAISPPVVDAPMDVGGVRVRPVKRVQPSGITARQMWLEPNLGALKAVMRRAYEERWKPNHSGRARLEERYSYDVVGKQLAAVIEQTTRRTEP